MAPKIDVLIPTYQRPYSLAITLTSLVSQTMPDFRVVISDQSETEDLTHSLEVQAVVQVLQAHSIPVTILKNLPRRGMAHQRQFLLDQSAAPYALFLDDDVILEPFVIANMAQAIEEEQCGFVGCALTGLNFVNDHRPEEEKIEFWESPVIPEQVRPGRSTWERHKLHNAANLFHVAKQMNLSADHPRRYKVAWVGGCVLYDSKKFRSVGGFSFWTDLPEQHAGEDVLAQLRVMDEYGGCGLIPAGVYHLQIPTTLPNRSIDAPKVLEVEGYKHESPSE
jgi:GT2 family glycosyltransferase